MGEKIRVFNPMGYSPKITQLGVAERLETLDCITLEQQYGVPTASISLL